MARQLISLFFPVLIFVGLLHGQTFLVSCKPQVPCYFIFGDSLVDSGNNNRLTTAAKANYLPYGIDFPEGVTGRFTNGRTAADIIGQQLGFVNFIPPYATVTDEEISTGVNYGSGAAGIREESGSIVKLYNLGARKVVVFGLSQLGCMPVEIATFGTNGKPCVQMINDAVKLFNNRLKTLVEELNNDLFDAKFTFINVTGILAPQGDVQTPNVVCCQVKSGACVPNSIPCPVRALSNFYDDVHPTEVVNAVIATRSYVALSDMDASPYDISHLARV